MLTDGENDIDCEARLPASQDDPIPTGRYICQLP